MRFARAELLWLIWTLPLLALVYFYGWRKRRRILMAFARAHTLERILPAGIAARRRWCAVLVLSASLCTAVALSGPQYGFRWQEIQHRGIDIVIALDCSRSMLAADIQPTRLDRAKRKIYDLLNMLQGDRVGLVAFSGTAFLQCPLTIDYSAFNLFLDVLNPDYLPVGGSDLASALQSAQDAFDPGSQAEKAIILITDGEHTGAGDPLAAAQSAKQAGVRIFTIGVGSGDGVPVPAAKGGFKKDAGGQIVLSRLDEPLLTRIALTTGGSYVRSVAGDMDLETIYVEQIRSRLDAATVESSRRQVWADRFQWPLALAVMLLFLSQWLAPMKRTLAALVLPVALLAYASAADAGPLQEGYHAYQQGAYDKALKQFIDGQLQDPDNPSLLYNIGNAYYKNGNYEAAREHYRQALPHAPEALKPRLLYNMGNSAYRLGDLQEAVQHYQAALKLAPKDQQAKENLAFVKAKLQKQPQQNNQQQENGSPQNKPPQSNAQNRHNQQPSEQKKEAGQPPPQQPPESDAQGSPQAEQQDKPPQEKSGDLSADQEMKKQAPQNAPTATPQMLNRLKDQPGRALMPEYQKRSVEKDW